MAKQVDSTNIGTLLEALITKIKSFFWRKDETSQLPIDNTPTSGSNNLVKSGGVYSSLQGIRQLKVLNLGNFTPSHGSVTLGTKAEAAVALNITEAQVDSLLNCEYDYIEFNTAFFGGLKIFSVPSHGSGYMCIGLDEHYVMMMPCMLHFQKSSDVYSYDFFSLGIKDVTVGGESVIGSGSQEGVAIIPAIPDVSQFITRSVNDLANYYLKSETYTQTEVNNLIGAIQQFHYEIAASTSAVTNPSNNVLYLIGPTGSGADKYEEYVYDATKPVAERWVKIGDTSIDLSGYVTTQALNAALAGKTLVTIRQW